MGGVEIVMSGQFRQSSHRLKHIHVRTYAHTMVKRAGHGKCPPVHYMIGGSNAEKKKVSQPTFSNRPSPQSYT